MNLKILLKVAEQYEDTLVDVPLATLRQTEIPFSPPRSPNISIIDADGLTDQDYTQSDPAREQTLTRLREAQRLTSKALQVTSGGYGPWDILPYLVQIQNIIRSAEENCKLIEE